MTGIIAIAALAAFLALPAHAQEIGFEVTDLGDGLYVIMAVGGFGGGNVGVSVGEDGVVVIDDSMPPLSDKLLAAIGSITDRRVSYVINTHWHGDHVGGNVALAGAGATIVAHDNVRLRMAKGNEQSAPAAPEALPVITFSESVSFHMNGHDAVVHHPPRAHTDGDAIIHFRGVDVIHAGDTLFNGMYPYLDVDSGGSIDGYIAALRRIHALAGADTRIIAGHGPMASKADLQRNLDMLQDVRARVAKHVQAGDTLETTIAADPLADLNDEWAWDFISGELIVTAVYRSLSQ